MMNTKWRVIGLACGEAIEYINICLFIYFDEQISARIGHEHNLLRELNRGASHEPLMTLLLLNMILRNDESHMYTLYVFE